MTELRLKFKPGLKDNANAGFPLPKAEDIVSSCPNLKKLQIRNWPGTNKALTVLWSCLPGLQEISLEYCCDLGNVAYVGEDVRDPVFFKLKNLKKLTLMGLDQMAKITDTFLSVVLANMKITCLILTSGKPLENIIASGIKALSESQFGKTIEKFEFNGWSLSKMSHEAFQKMGKDFRSYDMI